jgi:hypothetical protein
LADSVDNWARVIVADRVEGVAQVGRSLNSIVAVPVGTALSVWPELSHAVVPTRRHLAPAATASAGVMLTFNDPVWRM